MLSDEIQEKLAERLVDRIEELNTTILEEIGKAIKKIGALTPSQAYKLAQMLKYGSSSKKIIRKLAQITKLNQKDIRKILIGVAKNNLEFSKPFFEYKGIDFVPYEQNKALQQQVDAIAKLTSDKYINFMSTSAFKTMKNGKAVFTPISKVYQKTLDRAVLAVSQGKESYQSAMRKTMRELAENGIICIDDKGIKKVSYATGYKRRLDSTVRMNILDGMRQLSNEMQQQFGETFGADGVEISVHANPAPDHQNIQGRQFSTVKPNGNEKSEWEKLQGGETAVDYNGIERTLDHDGKNGYRPISTMNCYHYVFSVILGINKPQYSEEQLQVIKEKANTKFEFEGKKYTMYQGTQLQRTIETKIRTLKDRQIIARASDDKDEISYCQRNIRLWISKYDKLCKVSGLDPRKQRLSVSGYHQVGKRNN